MAMAGVLTLSAQNVNDNNTPLHLMKPAYRVGYGVSTPEQVKQTMEVKQTMDVVLRYIDAETPAMLVDKKTGEEVKDLKKANADTQLKQGGFRLTSYEWGVTYSGVLAAYKATGDDAYRDYVTKRHQLLADIAPVFREIYAKDKAIDVNIRRVIDPHALDDAGAVCCSMITIPSNRYPTADRKLCRLYHEQGVPSCRRHFRAHPSTEEYRLAR